MTDSIRQQIIEKIDARLKTIKKNAGYKTDAGTHVYDWLGRVLAASELPAIIYKDKRNNITPETNLRSINEITIEIVALAESVATTGETVREVVEDIYKAIGTDEKWSCLAMYSEPVSDEMEIQQADKIIGQATITITILYDTAKWSY